MQSISNGAAFELKRIIRETPPTMELQPNDDLYCFGSATAYLSFKATISSLEKGQIDFAWIRDWIERCLASCGRLPNGHNVGFQKAVEALGKRAPLISSSPQAPAATSVSHEKQLSVGQPKEQQQKIFYGKDSATIDRQVWKFMRQLKTGDWTEADWYDFYRLLTDAFTQIAKRHLAHNASLGDEQKEQE